MRHERAHEHVVEYVGGPCDGRRDAYNGRQSTLYVERPLRHGSPSALAEGLPKPGDPPYAERYVYDVFVTERGFRAQYQRTEVLSLG